MQSAALLLVMLGLPIASGFAHAAAADSGRAVARAAAAQADTAASPRIVRRLEEFVVRARLHDPGSSETVHEIPQRTLRALPIDGLAGAIALKAGVVAEGEQLHVRGGRAGEARVVLDGIALNEPLRDRPPELPLLAVRSVSLVSGGLDAEYGGALAGVLDVRTVDPGASWSGEALWRTDGRRGTHYDRVSARLGGPIGVLGLGATATAEVTLDDTWLPSLRSAGRQKVGFGSLGWRADNRMLGHFKLAPVAKRGGFTFQALGSRRVDRPYNAMFTLDGWTTPCVDPPYCGFGPGYSPTPAPGYARYHAADHTVMTDERRVDAVLSYSLPRERDRLSAALGFTRVRSLTSVGGRDDESYLKKGLGAYFGQPDSPFSDAFLAYGGNEPYFRKTAANAWSLRADYERWTPRGSGGKAGLGGTYHGVDSREMDVSTYGTGLDSLRSYQAFAPGAHAYAQGRWVFEGLVLNAGLRSEYFTAGPQAARQSFSEPASGLWSLSPRLGVAYPISARDVFSLAYIRIQQNPARDFLYDQRTKPNSYRPLGNPAIEPATVISWQAALKHLIGERWSLQGAVFMRDVYGEVGARNFVPRSVPWFRYEGADDAHATGWELSLAREDEAGTSLELHYTWMMANGSESLEDGIPYYLRTGLRPVPIGVHTLDWDRRHTLTVALWREWRTVSLSWSTQAGSGLPWTPATRRQLEGDLSRVNTRRFGWTEWSALSLRWSPPWLGSHASVGFEVRNVFDFRGDRRATLDGYPQPVINTIYDDYGAFREETGLGGGAYWDDANNDGLPGWTRVHDARLTTPPRTVRLGVGASW